MAQSLRVTVALAEGQKVHNHLHWQHQVSDAFFWPPRASMCWAAEYNIYPLMFGWTILWISSRSIGCMIIFNSEVLCSFCCYCPDDPSIGESGVLKSPTIVGLVLTCVFFLYNVSIHGIV